ncbi:S-methyl-5'-thioinosine phosphorylase [Cardiobacterium sp. AH-315-I02]|nr:S-methyl-5'-thioinosine phosphorylase [Cardiobacterium sp. AH-315-I02]
MKLAIIGGSLFNKPGNITEVTKEKIKTPFGTPSDTFTVGTIDDVEVVYLNRHGRSHHLAPHQINYRANMFALKILEVTHVIAVTAVGGISENMPPMKWVVPDQIIDYTYGRMQTYNDCNEVGVNHIDFSYPFDTILSDKLITALETEVCAHEKKAIYGATQGPRLETIAEIKRMQNDGCDIVGMTAMPEAALARELEMGYAMLSLVVNWAAGKGVSSAQSAAAISMDEIKQRIVTGNETVENLISNVVGQLD